MSRTMKKGALGGLAAATAVAIVTAVGSATTAYPGKVLETDLLVYVGWVAGVTFLGCLGLAKYYGSLPDKTPVHKLLAASVLVGIPAFASGQLLPWTRPYPSIAEHLATTANLSFFVVGGILTMWVFLYVFDWRGSRNPIFTGGKTVR